MARGGIVFDESNYRAREDVRTLVEAKKIEDDKKRFAAAKKEAKRQVDEMNGMLDEEKE